MFGIQFIALFFIGMANALPMPLMGSTLSIWLIENGFDKSSIGLFALVNLPMSFKIFWTPFLDRFTLPFFKKSPRKGWTLFSLAGIIFCILGISASTTALTLVAYLVALSFFTGCLYMVGISYELESIPEESYPLGSANVIAGYRIGLLTAGSGILFISSLFSWSVAFQTLACLIAIGFILVLFLPEPYKSKEILKERKEQFLQYPSLFNWFWNEILVKPSKAFLMKQEWPLILLLLFFFKAGDEMSKCMEGPFYLSLGFSKIELASAAKSWGMMATLFGAYCGGLFMKSKGSFYTLIAMGLLHATTLSCHCLMAFIGKSLPALYTTVALEHFTGGLLMTSFVAFLWKHCSKQYAAIQYALLWSLISFKTDLFACLGGFLASQYSWQTFYLIITSVAVITSLIPLAFSLRFTTQIPEEGITR